MSSRSSLEPTVDPKVIEAIRAVVEYNWASERADYERQDDAGRTRHVFGPLTTLAQWLNGAQENHAAVVADVSSPAWGEAADAFDKAFDYLDSVERSIQELLEDPANDSDALHELRGSLMAGIQILRSVADTIEAKTV